MATPSDVFRADYQDDQGYTFSVEADAPTLSESISNAVPGSVDIFLSGSVDVTNTTEGRNAPFFFDTGAGFEIVVRAPVDTCEEFPFQCVDGAGEDYTLLGGLGTLQPPLEVAQNLEIPDGGTATLTSSELSTANVPDYVDSTVFYWTVSGPGQPVGSSVCDSGAAVCDASGRPWFASDGGQVPGEVLTFQEEEPLF